uniref:Uncharacterized protein n=1 Tax=Solanum lycopersicum TaxID=4081 RepID=A0A3Q7IWK0_SOLLC
MILLKLQRHCRGWQEIQQWEYGQHNTIPKQVEFEEIRSRLFEKPNNNNNKPNVYCDEPMILPIILIKLDSPKIIEDTIPYTALLANSNMKVLTVTL